MEREVDARLLNKKRAKFDLIEEHQDLFKRIELFGIKP